MTIFVPLLVSLIGLVVYLLTTHPKAAELGRIAFAFGLLVTLMAWSGHPLHLVP